MDPAVVRRWAEEHEQARRTATQIEPPTFTHPDMDLDDAYAIQQAWVELQVAAGARLVGHKIGLTSRAMQAAMRIDEPDFGALLDDMVFDDGAELAASRFCDPKIEVELAFVLGRPLAGPDVTMLDVLSATEYVVPALELIDARSYRVHPQSKAPRTVRDTIADNAADAGVIVGGRPVGPGEVDLRWVAALAYRNGVVEESGVAAAVLNNPANGVAWLARRYASLGRRLEPGQLVLSGSFTRPLDARPGDVFHVDYGPLGAIGCRFV
jgi:2-oxo-hept-3-ene-1,7-dioate hydratase